MNDGVGLCDPAPNHIYIDYNTTQYFAKLQCSCLANTVDWCNTKDEFEPSYWHGGKFVWPNSAPGRLIA